MCFQLLNDVCDGGLRCGLMLRRSGTLSVVVCHILTRRIKFRVVMSQVFVVQVQLSSFLFITAMMQIMA